MSGLGQFVKKSVNTFADALQARACADGGKPLIVRVNEYKTGLKTQHNKDGNGEGVVVDVIDLGDQNYTTYCNVLWMGEAVRDQLKDYAGTGQFLPVKLVWAVPQGGGMKYVTPEPLEGQELQLAEWFVQNYPTYLDDQKNAKMAAWQEQQASQAQVPQAAPAVPAFQGLQGPAPQNPGMPGVSPQTYAEINNRVQQENAAQNIGAPAPAPAPAPQAPQPQYAAPAAQAPAPPAPAPQAAPAPAPQQAPAAPAPQQYAAPPAAPAPGQAPPPPQQYAAAQPGQVTDGQVDALLQQL